MTVRSLVPPSVVPYTRRHRYAARDLIFRSYRVHTHLDWHETDDWLDTESYPVRLAWEGERLVGLIGMSKPLNGTCWIRIGVVSDYGDATRVMAALWNEVAQELREQGVHTVAILVSRDWILTHLRTLGFSPVEEIVTMERPRLPILNVDPPEDISIRLVRSDEIDALTRVDQAAFDPPWQTDRADIRQAEKISALGTAAVADDTVVAYALATVFIDGAHLARLAVTPAMQGRGIASALISDLLKRFARRSIFNMTVNTQGSNLRSQHVYKRFGFARNGYDLPVWMIQLT